MTYDYDNAPTDPRHGGKMTAEQARQEIERLRGALELIRAQITAPSEGISPPTALWIINEVNAALAASTH